MALSSLRSRGTGVNSVEEGKARMGEGRRDEEVASPQKNRMQKSIPYL